MAIVLINEEKKALFKFLSLFWGSSFILSSIIAYLFFRVEYNLNYDLEVSKLENQASKISSLVIRSHMDDKPLMLHYFKRDYNFALYDKDKKVLLGNLNKEISLLKKEYIDGKDLVVIDRSVSGHLGAEYVAVVKKDFSKIETTLIQQAIIGLLVVLVFLGFVGYYLGKLFIKPIEMQINKLNEFIKDTTHELNTPITALLMSAKNPSKDIDKTMRRISISANRVSEIYKDLTYLFLEEKKEATKIELREIIEEEMNFFKVLAERKNIEINLNLQKSYLVIDKESFIRVFNNLVSNAIKYNKNGGKVTVTLEKNSLSVQDTGQGVAKDKITEIFKRYYRAENRSGGFGIGLDIVSRICQENSITIEVESKKNQGSLFKLLWDD